MPNTLDTVKTAALETYVTVLSSDARRIRAVDRIHECRSQAQSDDAHIRAAMGWMCRAHDMGVDDGVAAMFSLVEGWMGSYPETTGYIIPTFYDAARRFACEEYRDRAREMGEWLLTCQSQDGSFPGSFLGRLDQPRVFNTGQIIFGLLRCGAETGEGRFVDAADRAGAWLLSQQDEDGAWRRSTLQGIEHTYNARTAWALARLAKETAETRFLDASLANIDWVLARQDKSGWFRENTFLAHEKAATLHTIAYAARGLLEVGVIAGRQDCIDAADRAAGALYRGWRLYETVSGAYARDWQVSANWRCLPGEAQTAIVWLRLHQLLGREDYRTTALALLEQLKTAQILDEDNADLHGGISGSLPINGAYERYCFVNWGPKFLVDALLLKDCKNGEHPTG